LRRRVVGEKRVLRAAVQNMRGRSGGAEHARVVLYFSEKLLKALYSQNMWKP
jgi:hypothetical protein